MHRSAALQACLNSLRDSSPALEPEGQDTLLLTDAAGEVYQSLDLQSSDAASRHRLIADAYINGLQIETRTRQLGRTSTLQAIAAGLALGSASMQSSLDTAPKWTVARPQLVGRSRARDKKKKKQADKSRRRNRA